LPAPRPHARAPALKPLALRRLECEPAPAKEALRSAPPAGRTCLRASRGAHAQLLALSTTSRSPLTRARDRTIAAGPGRRRAAVCWAAVPPRGIAEATLIEEDEDEPGEVWSFH